MVARHDDKERHKKSALKGRLGYTSFQRSSGASRGEHRSEVSG